MTQEWHLIHNSGLGLRFLEQTLNGTDNHWLCALSAAWNARYNVMPNLKIRDVNKQTPLCGAFTLNLLTNAVPVSLSWHSLFTKLHWYIISQHLKLLDLYLSQVINCSLMQHHDTKWTTSSPNRAEITGFGVGDVTFVHAKGDTMQQTYRK